MLVRIWCLFILSEEGKKKNMLFPAAAAAACKSKKAACVYLGQSQNSKTCTAHPWASSGQSLNSAKKSESMIVMGKDERMPKSMIVRQPQRKWKKRTKKLSVWRGESIKAH
jgi:hypothetical protein